MATKPSPNIIAKSMPPSANTGTTLRCTRCSYSSTPRNLPRNNGVAWRGNSGLSDGATLPDMKGGLVGGYYNAGDNIKFHFPMAFSMTMLSWSVIEYSNKYKALGEYDHVRDLIR